MSPQQVAAEKTSERSQPRWFGSAVVVMLLYVGGMVTVYFLFGRITAEKIATELVMPLGLLTVGLTVLCLHAVRRRLLPEILLSAGLLLGVLVAGNRLVANRMIGRLEQRYSTLNPLSGPIPQQIFLLGGATRETPGGEAQVNQNGDRVVMAARLYHRGLISKIHCSGTKTAGLSKAKKDESELAKILLVDLGVPEEAIEMTEGRNTAEEMNSIAQQVSDNRIGILTSAWHLPRAMRLAQASGLDAVAIPSDFLGDGAVESIPAGAIVRDCVPGHQALAINSRALREYLASLVKR